MKKHAALLFVFAAVLTVHAQDKNPAPVAGLVPGKHDAPPHLVIARKSPGEAHVMRLPEIPEATDRQWSMRLAELAVAKVDPVWKGRDADGVSANSIVVHTSSDAPLSMVDRALELAAAAKVPHVAVGVMPRVATPMDEVGKQDPTQADAGYLWLNLADAGKARAGEALHLALNQAGKSFELHVVLRDKVRVMYDLTSLSKLVPAPGADEASRKACESAAAAFRAAVAAELKEVTEGQANVTLADLRPVPGTEAPWALLEQLVRAVREFREGTVTPLMPFQASAILIDELPYAPMGEPKGFKHRIPKGGGGVPYADRVNSALLWLHDHQNHAGYWSAAGFSDDTTRNAAKRTHNIDFEAIGDRKGDKGWDDMDLGVTGLALMAYAGAGHTHLSGTYRMTITRALKYVLQSQDEKGCFGPRDEDHFVYNHAVCTTALCELYGLTGHSLLAQPCKRAVDFILEAQNPGLGWRYGIKPGTNDSSITCWMVGALYAARVAGIEYDGAKAFEGAREWFRSVTANVQGFPKCGYDAPGSNNARLRTRMDHEHNPTMDAAYAISMIRLGTDTKDNTVSALTGMLSEKHFLPTWDHLKIDYVYWYLGAQATHSYGGTPWDKFEKAFSRTLPDHQRGYHPADVEKNLTSKNVLDEHGSWDPVDAWGPAYGRVGATALNCLTMQTYYRYLRGGVVLDK